MINDPVTTTDELIPSGETSSFRSNPLRLAEFALSRKDPLYVGASKCVRDGDNADIKSVLSDLNFDFNDTTISSCILQLNPVTVAQENKRQAVNVFSEAVQTSQENMLQNVIVQTL